MNVLTDAIEAAAEFDQVNLGSLVCIEILLRRLSAMTKALEKGASQPSWEMAKHIMGETSPYDLLSDARRSEAHKAAREKLELDALRLRLQTAKSTGRPEAKLDFNGVGDALATGGLASQTASPQPRGPKPGRGERARGRGRGR